MSIGKQLQGWSMALEAPGLQCSAQKGNRAKYRLVRLSVPCPLSSVVEQGIYFDGEYSEVLF